MERLSATTTSLFIWIFKGKSSLQRFFNKIHLCSKNKYQSLWINEYFKVLKVDDFIKGLSLFCKLQRIRKARASLSFKGNTKACTRICSILYKLFYLFLCFWRNIKGYHFSLRILCVGYKLSLFGLIVLNGFFNC